MPKKTEVANLEYTFYAGDVKVEVSVPVNTPKRLPDSHFRHGIHECPDSYTDSCVYTEYSTDDMCIFCGNPDERK